MLFRINHVHSFEFYNWTQVRFKDSTRIPALTCIFHIPQIEFAISCTACEATRRLRWGAGEFQAFKRIKGKGLENALKMMTLVRYLVDSSSISIRSVYSNASFFLINHYSLHSICPNEATMLPRIEFHLKWWDALHSHDYVQKTAMEGIKIGSLSGSRRFD